MHKRSAYLSVDNPRAEVFRPGSLSSTWDLRPPFGWGGPADSAAEHPVAGVPLMSEQKRRAGGRKKVILHTNALPVTRMQALAGSRGGTYRQVAHPRAVLRQPGSWSSPWSA